MFNFAKQVLTYIDQRFLLDIDFLAQVSEAFTEIISNIRYYPYPTIVYKIAINKHLNQMGSLSAGVIPASSVAAGILEAPSIKSDTTPIQQPISQPTIESKPEEIHVSSTDNDQLLHDVLEKLDHGSFRDNLQNQIVIDEVTEAKVKIIAINKVSEMMLKKPENITHIQKIFSELL